MSTRQIVTNRDELINAIELFWKNLENAALNQREEDLRANVSRSININNGEFYCWSKGNTELYHYILFQSIFNEEKKNLMEVGIPLEYAGGRLKYGRVSKENGKYYLLRAVKAFRGKNVPNDFKNLIREKLKDDIITIDGKEWIKVCSINSFNQNSFLKILRTINSCKNKLDTNGDFLFEDIELINKDEKLTDTVKKQLIKARIGQGDFRDQIVEYWKGTCAVTECNEVSVLTASHIKPWRKSNNAERLDKFNGLLLSPNIDRLFDRGFISFDNKGKIKISSLFCKENRKKLGVSEVMSVKLGNKHETYMKYHRENIFRI